MSDPIKLSEQEKYRKYWTFHTERIHSPGMRAMHDFLDVVYSNEWTRILDAGCGFGRCLAYMTELKLDVMGCDIADNAISPEYKDIIENRFIVAPLWNLPFDDDCFDCVFSCDVFEHIPEDLVIESLEEIARVSPHAYLEIANFHREVGGLRVHMTVKPDGWWYDQISRVYEIESFLQRKPPKTGGIQMWLRRK